MKEKELLAFIEHIRKMCSNDRDSGNRMRTAFSSLRRILERQNVDSKYLDLLRTLTGDDEVRALGESNRIASMTDVERVLTNARALRRKREEWASHRGCM